MQSSDSSQSPESDDSKFAKNSGRPSSLSPEQAFRLEEYKVHAAFIIESQKRIVTLSIAALGLAATILGGTANLVYDSGFIQGSELLAYTTLFPGLILCAALMLIEGHRAAIAGTAGYIVVGIERAMGFDGFESRLRRLRQQQGPRREANDPIVLAFACFVVASVVVFAYSIFKILGQSNPYAVLWHLIAPAEVLAIFWWASRQFVSVIAKSVEDSIAAWEIAMVWAPQHIEYSTEVDAQPIIPPDLAHKAAQGR